MRKIWTIMVMVALLGFFGAGNVFAGNTVTIPATIVINPGPLSISSTGGLSFPETTLDGDDHDLTASAVPTLTIVDARGTGEGWNVTFQSSDFTAAGGRAIPASQLKFTSGGAIIGIKGQAISADNGPKETGLSGATLETARKAVTTAVNYGKGTYTYLPNNTDFVLSVSADQAPGNYSATLTVTVSNGP